jgi:endonuclease YncB( thermonuclease family)
MKAKRHLFLLLIVWVLGIHVPACWGQEFVGKVVGVSDGDTITVLRDRTPIKIRLHGIDSPESRQDFGSRAKSVTSELAFNQVVKVQRRDTDRYGRTVAEVILPDGRSLNQEVVRQGMAWWYRRYAPHDPTLSRLEAEARAAKRGLWSQPNPVPPWEWRSRGPVPPADLAGKFLGNKRSHVYHKPGCQNAASMSPANRIIFESADAAKRVGYRPARDCHP